MQVTACSAICPSEGAWDVAPSALGERLLATVSEARIAQILAACELPPDEAMPAAPVTVAPVKQAHYTPKETLVDAMVEGTAVRALCGTWFVPRRDTLDLPECQQCRELRKHLASVSASQ